VSLTRGRGSLIVEESDRLGLYGPVGIFIVIIQLSHGSPRRTLSSSPSPVAVIRGRRPTHG